jgi:hypothetical protein
MIMEEDLVKLIIMENIIVFAFLPDVKEDSLVIIFYGLVVRKI